MEKLLTVVIPTYNTEKYLAGCLDSMLQTSLAEYTEILVVDDGSRDSSGAIADDYAGCYPGIVRAIHKENGGHGSTINVGIREASGKYFKVVDSDDWVESAAYEKYLEQLKEIESDLIATRFTCVTMSDNGSTREEERQIEGAEELPEGTVLDFRKVAGALHVRMHEWTIRTSILREQEVCLTEHSFYVDMQYILYPVPWIHTICILPYAVYRYRLGSETQSVSVRNMQKNRMQHQAVMRSLVQFYQEREQAGDDEAVLAYLARGIAKMEANQVQIVLSLPIGKDARAELLATELEVMQECAAAYEANEKQSLWLLRKSRYLLYRVAALVWRVVKR